MHEALRSMNHDIWSTFIRVGVVAILQNRVGTFDLFVVLTYFDQLSLANGAVHIFPSLKIWCCLEYFCLNIVCSTVKIYSFFYIFLLSFQRFHCWHYLSTRILHLQMTVECLFY